MKTFRAPAPSLILGLLYVAFLGYLAYSATQLPDRVATHFNFKGEPDGWMSRTAHLQFMAVFGLAIPLFLSGVFSLCRFFPQGLNVPHRDYWLAPERRSETYDYLQRQGIWFACLFLVFLSAIHATIIHANRLPNARMPGAMVGTVAIVLIVGSLVWCVRLFLHFSTPQVDR